MEYTMTRADLIRLLQVTPGAIRYLEKEKRIKYKIDKYSKYANKRKYYNKESVMSYLEERNSKPRRVYECKARTINKGYVLITMPTHPAANSMGCVPEHRLVMEKHLGRYLTELEVVHHIDGDRANNKIENLHLFSSQAEHLSEAQHLTKRILSAACNLSKRTKLLKLLEKLENE